MESESEREQVGESKSASHWKRWLIPVGVAVAVLALFLVVRRLPVKEWLVLVLEYCKGLGGWAVLAIILAYVLACVLMFPGTVLSLGAGFVFAAMVESAVLGVAVGTLVVDFGATLGASVAFLLGRKFARGWVEKKVAHRPKFQAIDRAVGRQGFKIVLLTRLTPVFPFVLQNYAYGLTDVPLLKYAVASFVGMLPGTLMFVYFGAAAQSLAAAAAGTTAGGTAQRVFTWVGLVVAVVVAVVVTRIARRALREAGQESGAEELAEN